MPICSHFSSILGSFWGRFAFMGKAVWGRLMVFLSSNGTEWRLQMIESSHYREASLRSSIHGAAKDMSLRRLPALTKSTVVMRRVELQFYEEGDPSTLRTEKGIPNCNFGRKCGETRAT